jgi:hypothetical protein
MLKVFREWASPATLTGVTIRNNLFDTTGGTFWPYAINAFHSAAVINAHFYNNTCIDRRTGASPGQPVQCVKSTLNNDVSITNNLFYGPNVTGAQPFDNINAGASNNADLSSDSNVLATWPATTVEHYRLNALATGAIDQGTSIQGSRHGEYDFFGETRETGPIDIGADEF